MTLSQLIRKQLKQNQLFKLNSFIIQTEAIMPSYINLEKLFTDINSLIQFIYI